MSLLRLILSGLWLPFKLYLQPNKFRQEIDALAPDLPPEYSLWQARRHLRQTEFRHGLYRLALQTIIALCWVPLCLGVFVALGYPVYWIGAAFQIIPFSVFGVAYGVAYGVAKGVVNGVVFGVVFCVAVGLAEGVAFFVALSVALSVATGVATVPLSVPPIRVVVGVAIGLMFGVAIGLKSGVALGVKVGVFFGVNLGVILLMTLHFPTLVLQWPYSLLTWPLPLLSPRTSRWLWHIHPVRWDEVILLPLPGLPSLLATLYRLDSVAGREALAETAAHRFQYRAAYRAWAMLAQEQALGIASLPSLGQFHSSLDWLKDDTPLPKALRGLLLSLRDISREIASALESDSATNQRRRLEAARGLLETLSKQRVGEFGPAIIKWTGLVEAGLTEARRRQQQDEPIPQVYHGDGRPVRPDGRAEALTPFKGRRALFRRLEEALGGAGGQRSTYLLVGQRRSGKTSALLHLERRLGSQLVPAFLDLQSEKLGGAADAAGLLHGLADAVNDEARRREVIVPDLTRRMLDADPYPAFGRWLDGVEQALGSRRLLLCLDEYEALEVGLAAGRFDERLLMALRNIVQHRRRVDVLLSGSRHIDELPPRWASSLVNTLALPISFLEEPDARELIVAPVQDFPAIYRPATVERILSLSHCQPYLIQLLCTLLVERMNKARRMPPASWVEVDDVDAVIPLALERGPGYFSDLWRGQTGGETAQGLLEALAEADGLALELTALRQVEPDAWALQQALRHLQRREIIAQDGERYRILVPLVGEYVRRQTR